MPAPASAQLPYRMPSQRRQGPSSETPTPDLARRSCSSLADANPTRSRSRGKSLVSYFTITDKVVSYWGTEAVIKQLLSVRGPGSVAEAGSVSKCISVCRCFCEKEGKHLTFFLSAEHFYGLFDCLCSLSSLAPPFFVYAGLLRVHFLLSSFPSCLSFFLCFIASSLSSLSLLLFRVFASSACETQSARNSVRGRVVGLGRSEAGSLVIEGARLPRLSLPFGSVFSLQSARRLAEEALSICTETPLFSEFAAECKPSDGRKITVASNVRHNTWGASTG